MEELFVSFYMYVCEACFLWFLLSSYFVFESFIFVSSFFCIFDFMLRVLFTVVAHTLCHWRRLRPLLLPPFLVCFMVCICGWSFGFVPVGSTDRFPSPSHHPHYSRHI